jgi:hypothetical protein
MVEGFGVLLLELIQKVGFMTLVGIIISAIIVLAFGTFLLLMSRLFKPKIYKATSTIEGGGNSPKSDSLTEKEVDKKNNKKMIQPETLEEIEAREKNSSKNKE